MKGVKNTVESIWLWVDKTKDCWEWTGARDRGGYGVSRWSGKWINSHRLFWEIVNGVIPNGMCVLHRCDNRICVKLEHLFLGTKADNNKDRAAKGRSAKGDKIWSVRHPELLTGELNPRAIITEKDVMDIRTGKYFGKSHRETGLLLGISGSTVGNIIARRIWKHVS